MSFTARWNIDWAPPWAACRCWSMGMRNEVGMTGRFCNIITESKHVNSCRTFLYGNKSEGHFSLRVGKPLMTASLSSWYWGHFAHSSFKAAHVTTFGVRTAAQTLGSCCKVSSIEAKIQMVNEKQTQKVVCDWGHSFCRVENARRMCGLEKGLPSGLI